MGNIVIIQSHSLSFYVFWVIDFCAAPVAFVAVNFPSATTAFALLH
jgi:hypothetical protein